MQTLKISLLITTVSLALVACTTPPVSQDEVDAATQAQKAGLLLGNIASRQLGQQLDRSFRSAYQDWAGGLIDLDAFKNLVMTATCLCYAADAAPATRASLLKRLQRLDKARPKTRTGSRTE